MIDSERDPVIEQIAREARRPVGIDAGARERLLELIRAEGAPGSFDDEAVAASPRSGITLTTARFAALAAGLVGIGALLGSTLRTGRDNPRIVQPQVVASTDPSGSRLPASSSDTVVTFVFVANAATKVSVVGDFNQWNTEATPMRRIAGSNAWSVTVPLSAGRHLYSFLAVGSDGEKWIADPYAPAAPDDGFGRANSVVLVGKGSAS